MPDLWYYGRNEQRHGPVPLEELKRLVSLGNLDASDLVWSSGMVDWVPASEVDGLFSATAPMVTPPPPSEATSPLPPPPEAESPPANDRWYYEQHGDRCGPVAFEELGQLAVSGQIQPDNLVWKLGMPEWLSAEQVGGLFPQSVSPPPSASEDVRPPQVPPAAAGFVTDERWHYEQEGERCGPVSFEELRHLAATGQIQADNLTWKRGMAEWTPAGQINGLFLSGGTCREIRLALTASSA